VGESLDVDRVMAIFLCEKNRDTRHVFGCPSLEVGSESPAASPVAGRETNVLEREQRAC